MAIHIRPFLNTDSPQLVRLWNVHHQLAGMASGLSESAWEYSVLAKLMFDPQGLLVAEMESEPVGFIHAVKLEEERSSVARQSTGLLNALCIAEHADEQVIADQLLKAAESFLKANNGEGQILTAGPEHYAFYLGIGESGGLLGVSSRDKRLQQWLESAGYRTESAIETWQLSLNSFRPPMDRVQIMIRRQGRVEMRDGTDIQRSWWRSALMGHAELSTFRLIMRDTLQSVEVDFWQPEFAMHNGSAAVFLDMPQAVEQSQADHYTFLIADGIKHFQQGRVPRIRATIYSEATQSGKLLERLGFRKELTGQIYTKP